MEKKRILNEVTFLDENNQHIFYKNLVPGKYVRVIGKIGDSKKVFDEICFVESMQSLMFEGEIFEYTPRTLKGRENAIELYDVKFENSFRDIVWAKDVNEELAVIGVRAIGTVKNHYKYPDGTRIKTDWIQYTYQMVGVTVIETYSTTYKVMSCE